MLLLVHITALLGTDPNWWHRGGQRMRTISPKCDSLGPADLIPLIERLAQAGERVVALNAVYDSGTGYDASSLWCGLAGSNYTRPDPASIGTTDQWLALVSKAHSLGLKMVAWFNPSYIWTGSPVFKMAEKDVKRYGLKALPPASPAHYFRWSTTQQAHTHVKPADSAPHESGLWAWVWDEDAGASYLSTWAGQPCTDLASPEWRAEVGRILTFWIEEMHIDGFVFDYPDGYIGGGVDTRGMWKADPAQLKSALMDVIHSTGKGSVAAFAELYGQPERAVAYGLDGSLADATDGSRPSAIANAIAKADASGLDVAAFGGVGGPDAVNTLCYLSSWCAVGWQRQVVSPSWLAGDSALNVNQLNCYKSSGAAWAPDLSGMLTLHECFDRCKGHLLCEAITVDWGVGKRSPSTGEPLVGCYLRGLVKASACDQSSAQFSTFAKDAPQRTQLLYGIAAAGGVVPAVEYDAAHSWWSDASWPGGSGATLDDLVRAMSSAASFSTSSLRTALPTSSAAHYAFARYDAKGTGKLSLVVANLGAHAATAKIDLSALPAAVLHTGKRPADLVSGASLAPLAAQYSVHLPAHSMRLVGEVWLDTWAQHEQTACSQGHGASYAPDSSGTMSVVSCMLTCLADSMCDGVTMEWSLDALSGRCFKRGGIALVKCEVGAGGFSTFVRSTNTTKRDAPPHLKSDA